MATSSIIQKSQLEGALRLDAEYYQPEYLELVKNLNNLGAVPIKDIAKNPKRKFKPQEGKIFQYIEISEVDLSTGEYNKKEVLGENAPDRAQWIVKQGDVIISTVRPIRNAVSLIRENVDNLVCSSGFAVLKPEKVEPEYLFVYLKSQPIVKLLDRKTTATMYPAITVDDLLNMKIYLGDEKFRREIQNKVQEAQKELETSKSLYSQAENLLLEELGLKNFKVEEYLCYIVNSSQIKSAQRMDAEYFQPKYEKIFNYIKCPIKKLGEVTKFLNHGKQPPYIDKGEVPIITQKHLGKAFLKIEAINDPETKFTSLEWVKKYPSYKLKIGDVLYYSVGSYPYIGKTNIVLDDLNATVASFITIIRTTEEINPIYLTVVLNSVIGQLQSEKWQSATVQQYVYPKDIKNFKIPILPIPTQQEIAGLVRQSHEARKKAKELLEEAKRKVEECLI
ncbi:MAG: restriction endonuclease subunit S [Candidatus Omnitrophica bacterium]|nr:restriction endonuclease subunit S [Candidatus Omnitrophota bacterium]